MAKVLVVEDEDDIAALVHFRLSSDGHEVTVATDGEGALRSLTTSKPDLVVLDWMLPGMNGIEVCAAIRADPALADTLVMVLTARSQEADLEEAYGAGADDYLRKPFSFRELSLRTASLLGRPRG